MSIPRRFTPPPGAPQTSAWHHIFRALALGLAVVGSAETGLGPAQAAASSEHESSPRIVGITEPFLDARLSIAAVGVIREHKVREGDWVEAGAVLSELDLRIEELDIERKRLTRDRAKVDLDATRVLYEKSKGLSQDELLNRELEFRVAEVDYELARESYRRRQLIAPFAGCVSELILKVGEGCQPEFPVLRLVDTRRAFLVVDVEPSVARALPLGATAALEFAVGEENPVQTEGTVHFVSPVVDPASGLRRVKVLFHNPQGRVPPGVAGALLLKGLKHGP